MLEFLECLVAAVFLAAATPEEMSARVEFSFSLVEWIDFLTIPPDMTAPLRDLWAGAAAAAAVGCCLVVGGIVIVGTRSELSSSR